MDRQVGRRKKLNSEKTATVNFFNKFSHKARYAERILFHINCWQRQRRCVLGEIVSHNLKSGFLVGVSLCIVESVSLKNNIASDF